MTSATTVLVAAAMAAATLAGCGGGGASGPAPASPLTGSAQAPPPASPAHRRPPKGGLNELRAALHHELALVSPHTGAYVYDLTTHRAVFDDRATIGRPPASVEKLFTSVALLAQLGPHAHLHTVVLGTGELGAGGVWHGNLYLRGGGDPTFGSASFARVWQRGYGANISDLVSQLTARGIKRVTGSVIGDPTLFDELRGGPSTGFAADLADIGGELSGLSYNHGESGGTAKGAITPGAYAAEQLALGMHAAHIQAVPAPTTAKTPRRARILASVRSPSMSVLLRLMNVPSDDFYAEMLTKLLGARLRHSGSIPSGTVVIEHALAHSGIHPRVADGSGLSRDDQASPIQVVDLLRAVFSTSAGRVLNDSLPVVGVNGTVRRIAANTVARGRCIAKTGTLNYVTNLAGYCEGGGRQQLAFAFFIDGPPNQTALLTITKLVTDLVRLNAGRP